MNINNNDDVLFGRSQLITPSKTIIAELVKNGKSPAEIDAFLKTGNPVFQYEPLHCYVKAQGYCYGWGHIIESIEPIEGDEKHYFYSLNFFGPSAEYPP